ncbi:MAG: hypothetical protein ACRDPW_10790 [Mycobacteriales bacterium]
MVNGQQFFVGGSFTDQNRLIVAVAGAAPETGEVSLEGGGAFTDGSVEIRQLEASKLGAKGTPVGCAVVEIVAAGKSSVYGFQVQKGDAFSNPHTPVESTLNLKPTTLTAAQADQHMRQATKPLAGGTGDSCTLAR